MLRQLWLASMLCAVSLHGQEISAIVNLGDWSGRLAGHSLAAIFGQGLADRECVATQVPLPTELCGVSVLLTNDSEQDMEALAPLFYVSPGQINFQVPVSEWMVRKDPLPPRFASGAFVYLLPSGVWSGFLYDDQAPVILEYPTPSGQAPILVHADGALVTDENPAEWNEPLTAYGTGFGIFTGTKAPGHWPAEFPRDGHPAPLDRAVEVYPARVLQITGEANGVPTAGSYVAADFVGLVPGFVGLNQVTVHLSCRLSRDPEPRIVIEGMVNGSRTKPYRIPMSAAATAAWGGPNCN
jgi:uncharacterized protein (TIGR03437 family)